MQYLILPFAIVKAIFVAFVKAIIATWIYWKEHNAVMKQIKHLEKRLKYIEKYERGQRNER